MGEKFGFVPDLDFSAPAKAPPNSRRPFPVLSSPAFRIYDLKRRVGNRIAKDDMLVM